MSPRRVDANQEEIVAALRAAGASVTVLSNVGRGCPDLLVGYLARCARCGDEHLATLLLEVKDGTKKASARRLTPDEIRFHQLWRGALATVTNVNEALAAIGRQEAT